MPTSEVYAIGECHVGGVTPFNVKGGAKSAVFGYEDGEMVATVYTEKADCSGASTSVTMKGDCSVAAKGDEHYGYSSKWFYTEEMPEAAASASTQQAKKASTTTKTLGTYGCSPCKTTSDCEAGFTCVDNKCHPPATAPMFLQMGALDKKTHPFDIMQTKYGMAASAPASKKAVPAPKDLKKEGKRADGDRRFVHVSMASSCGRAPTMSAGAQLDTCVDGRVLSCANGQVVDTKYGKADCSGKASAAVVATEGCAKHPQVADTRVNVACGALDAVPGTDRRTKRDGPGGYDVWAIFADEGTCDVKVRRPAHAPSLLPPDYHPHKPPATFPCALVHTTDHNTPRTSRHTRRSPSASATTAASPPSPRRRLRCVLPVHPCCTRNYCTSLLKLSPLLRIVVPQTSALFSYTDAKLYAQVYGDTLGCRGDYETVNMLDGCQSGSEEHEGYSSQWYVRVRSETNLGGTYVLCQKAHITPCFLAPRRGAQVPRGHVGLRHVVGRHVYGDAEQPQGQAGQEGSLKIPCPLVAASLFLLFDC